jgi:four helix bundle suffix protein
MIYDARYWFCEAFLDGRSRTVDQMVQAARSGRQNIAEASRAAAASSQTELRLVNVARASLEELLLDFEDFLRHRRLQLWKVDSPEALAVRRVGQLTAKDSPDPSDRSDPSDPSDQSNPSKETDDSRYARYAHCLDHADPAIRANALICLIHQANYLLDRQIEALEKQFVRDGSYSEQLAAARLAERRRTKAPGRSDTSDPSDRTDQIPACPQCGSATVLRTARQGKIAGAQFWGCSDYPDCKGIVKL